MITVIEKWATLERFFNNLRFSFPKLRTSYCRSDITIHHDFNDVDENILIFFIFGRRFLRSLRLSLMIRS